MTGLGLNFPGKITESGGIDGYTLTFVFKKLDALDLCTEDWKMAQ